jgi:uncharacterized protein with HEPN domain
MRPARHHRDYLRDMLEYALKARRFVEGVDYDDFCSNDEKVLAVLRALEVIGEAARHIPRSVRALSAELAWEDVVGMRDKLIHDYMGVDLEVVWRTLQEDLPPLCAAVERLLQDLECSGSKP